MLACLRGDARAAMYTLPARVLASRLSPDELALARQPLWMTRVVRWCFQLQLHAKVFCFFTLRDTHN